MARKAKYELDTLELDNMSINEIIQLDEQDVYRHCEDICITRTPIICDSLRLYNKEITVVNAYGYEPLY
jgi:hypothetical protein